MDGVAMDKIDVDFDDLLEHVKHNPIVEFKGVFSNKPLELNFCECFRFIRFSLQECSSFHLDTIEIFDENLCAVESQKKIIISSAYNDQYNLYGGENVFKGRKNGGCGFHTKNEDSPWLILDLGREINIHKVIIYNREGPYEMRAWSLKIDVCSNLYDWRVVFDNWKVVTSYKNGLFNKYEDALLHVVLLKPDKINRVIDLLQSQGGSSGALKMMDMANVLLRDKGLALGPHGITKTFSLCSNEKKQHIYSELSETLRIINDEFGVSAFISSGTLLGIVRDGTLIPHDDDVDICYVSNEINEINILDERNKLAEFLTQKGYKINRSNLAHYWCTTPGGVRLDIFTGFIEGDHCSLNPIGRRKVYVSDVFPLSKIKVDEADLWLPNNPKSLLALNYGLNWQTPDPLWKFNWQSAHKDFKFLYF